VVSIKEKAQQRMCQVRIKGDERKRTIDEVSKIEMTSKRRLAERPEQFRETCLLPERRPA